MESIACLVGEVLLMWGGQLGVDEEGEGVELAVVVDDVEGEDVLAVHQLAHLVPEVVPDRVEALSWNEGKMMSLWFERTREKRIDGRSVVYEF